jgi:hypothetical protein
MFSPPRGCNGIPALGAHVAFHLRDSGSTPHYDNALDGKEAHMTMFRSTLRLISITGSLLFAAAPALTAQDRTLFTWSGRVDREVQISMRGRDLWTNGLDQDDGARSRYRVESYLPRTDGYVRVETGNGRGDVAVVQQPASWNNYTTVIRIRDRSSGSSQYRVSAYWDARYSDNRGGYGGYGRHDGGYGNSNDTPSRIDPRSRDDGSWDRRGGSGGYNNGLGTALRWSGSVDNEVEIRLQGRRLDEHVLSGGVIRDERTAVLGDGIPRRDAQVVISQASGRGTIYVAQQPAAYNGYTAVIRIRDPQGGYGFYNFEVDYR